jgi:hypothetical protein
MIIFRALSANNVVDGRKPHNFVPGKTPSLLYYPRERTVLSVRFFLDFFKHVFGKIQTLFSLIRAGHLHAPRSRKQKESFVNSLCAKQVVIVVEISDIPVLYVNTLAFFYILFFTHLLISIFLHFFANKQHCGCQQVV